MTQIYYTLLHLIRGKGNNLIKVISLTLGLVVALVLFSKVAFEMGFDKSYTDADRIYRVLRNTSGDDKKMEISSRLYAAVVRDLKNELPEIEAGTTIRPPLEEYLQYEDRIFKEKVLSGDKHFFDLFNVKLLDGDITLMDTPSQIFISHSTAKRFFGNKSPIGQTLNRNRESLTVAGVFEDVTNSHLVYTAFVVDNLTEYGWHNPDPFMGYIKLSAGITPAQLEERISQVLPKFIDVEAMAAKGNKHEYSLFPVTQLHSGMEEVKRMIVIFSILAFSLLFVAAMNYVLISISSLAERAKTVGVLKCNGASNSNIFKIFFYETIGILLIALAFAFLLIFAFRGQIENIMQTPLSSLFSPHNLWVTGVVLIVLLLLAGIIPSIIFSAVPVTNLFKAYAVNKKRWKRILLFVQFTGAAFIFTLLVIIVRQYDLLLHIDLGYNTKNLYYSENISQVPRTQIAMLKNELERLPQVASVSLASSLPVNSLEGIGAKDIEDDKKSIPCVSMGVDKDYFSTMGIKLINGENVGENSNSYTRAVVNKSFVKQIGWTDSPIGKTFISGLNGKDKPIHVIGVIEDFKISSLNGKEFADLYPPVAIFSLDIGEENWLFGWERIMVKLHKTDEKTVSEINMLMQTALGKPNAFFINYNFLIAEKYQNALLYRNSILAVSLLLLFITVLGLLGFTQDEINRRSKEIAIRKIFGAEVMDVLYNISKGILLISIPAQCMGIVLSYVIGAEWLKQFAVKVPLTLFFFTYCAIIVLAGIQVCITARTWHVANENPINHIRTE